MCLSSIYSDGEMDEYLENQPEVIEVYKYVIANAVSQQYETKVGMGGNIYIYKSGLAKATQSLINLNDKTRYFSGFHFGLNKQAISNWRVYQDDILVRCLILKKWITAVGLELSLGAGKNQITIVASQAIFPHYPETEARYEDLPKEEITQTEKQEMAAVENKGVKNETLNAG